MKAFDTLTFCRIAGVEKAELVSEIKKARSYSMWKPSAIVKQLSAHRYAALQEQLSNIPDFTFKPERYDNIRLDCLPR